MQEALSGAACRAAEGYFARKRRAARCVRIGVLACLAAAVLAAAALLPHFGIQAAALGGCVLCILLLILLLVRRRHAPAADDYVEQVRPVLARELYPDCTFARLDAPAQMRQRLQEAAIWVVGGELTEYGGSLCLQTPAGTVYAHDFTEDCRPGDGERAVLQDWVVYELALPASSPWRRAGLLLIRRGRRREDSVAAAVQSALHRLPHMAADSLPEKRIAGTPLVFSAADPVRGQALLDRVGTRALRAFFSVCGAGATVCFSSGTLYVFARGQRLDQRWSDSCRLDAAAVARNADAVARTIHAVETLI